MVFTENRKAVLLMNASLYTHKANDSLSVKDLKIDYMIGLFAMTTDIRHGERFADQ